MARLNEFPTPTESIDALKRRFVRQNREIARVNSMQSLRIRSLESEVSHLLSENVSLREQIISLSQEIGRLEGAKMLHDGVYEIKSKLDAKLAELSHLATDLGMLPRKVNKLCEARPESPHAARPKTPEADARPGTTESDSNAGVDDGRLPAILEHKHYPRRTLEQHELQDLVQESLSIPASPSEGGAKAEAPNPERQSEVARESRLDNDLDDPFLPPTLETRKKKKNSEPALALEDDSAVGLRLTPTDDLGPALKSGSKRKFSPEDDEFVPCFVEDDEFQFSRPSHSPRKQTEPFEVTRQEHSPARCPGNMKRDPASPTSARRKVLEPKSTNVQLESPKKARSSLLREHGAQRQVGERDENTSSPRKFKDVEGHISKGGSQKTRAPQSEHASHQKTKRASRTAEKEAVIHIEPALPPEPSVIDLEEEPTKMPGLSGAPSRPSRRQRAVVSYAEPNLRDKMRRPTNELIDAVSGAQSRRSSSFQSGRESLSDEGERPTGEKINSSNSQSSTVPADLALADLDPGLLSRNATSDLLTTVSQRKRKVSSARKESHDGGQSNTMENEYHGIPSLSIIAETGKTVPDLPVKAPKEATAPTRQSRRHSSNPRTTGCSVSPHDEDMDQSRNTESPLADEGHDSPQGDVYPPHDVFGTAIKTSSASSTRQARHGQRVAARRKSMML